MDQIDWEDCENRVAQLVSRSELDPRAMAFLETLPSGTPVGVACSGGADSVLLTLVLQSRVESDLKWVLLHFDHGLRGRESAEDARFVSRLAGGLALSCHCQRWKTPGDPTEQTMRHARFSFLHQALQKMGGSVLCLGHQADDVVESMLMRIARGSGAAGLSAPRPCQKAFGGITHLRPLLRMDRLRIRSILSDAHAPWREDISNEGCRFLRNRLRNSVVPAWKEVENRDLVSGALLARDRLEDDDEALEIWLSDLVGADDRAGAELDLKILEGRPRALVRRAIDRWARQLPGLSGISRAWVEALVDLFQGAASNCVSAGRGGEVTLGDGVFRFRKIDESAAGWPDLNLPLGSTVVLPDGSWVRARRTTLEARERNEILSGNPDPSNEAWINVPEGGPAGLLVRSWRPGDRYRPLGAAGTVKIGDQFTNRKIPVERRRILPVFCLDDGHPVWCPELPPAEEVRLNEESIHAVQLTYCWSTATFHL
ncbi:MAG: tRNA lysidine(34) synthetase TilS [Verrucomicrobia bacterium]|nr:MAG: tRNA lysidine(34) synthetase TilS [Verrucomicrobiota bacterium]